MSNPVIWFEVIGADGEALKNFYSKTFDWQIDSNNPMNYGIVNTGSEKGIQGGIGGSNEGMKGATFYIGVDDLKAHLETVEANGGKVIGTVRNFV
jgi:predicted enzyme related to lactoylglutathione lyase